MDKAGKLAIGTNVAVATLMLTAMIWFVSNTKELVHAVIDVKQGLAINTIKDSIQAVEQEEIAVEQRTQADAFLALKQQVGFIKEERVGTIKVVCNGN